MLPKPTVDVLREKIFKVDKAIVPHAGAASLRTMHAQQTQTRSTDDLQFTSDGAG